MVLSPELSKHQYCRVSCVREQPSGWSLLLRTVSLFFQVWVVPHPSCEWAPPSGWFLLLWTVSFSPFSFCCWLFHHRFCLSGVTLSATFWFVLVSLGCISFCSWLGFVSGCAFLCSLTLNGATSFWEQGLEFVPCHHGFSFRTDVSGSHGYRGGQETSWASVWVGMAQGAEESTHLGTRPWIGCS